MLFAVECIVGCLIITMFVYIGSRNPISLVHNYPPAIKSRAQELGLWNGNSTEGRKQTMVKKILASIVIGVGLGLVVRYVNGSTTFLKGALLTYAIWTVVNVFDALVLDIAWFCHDKRFVLPGTEDLAEDYHDYMFHIRESLVGQIIGIPVACIAGLVCIVL